MSGDEVTEELVATIAELREQQWSLIAIATKIGIPVTTVAGYVSTDLQGRKRKTMLSGDEISAEVIRLRGEGLAMFEIASRMNISRATLNKYISEDVKPLLGSRYVRCLPEKTVAEIGSLGRQGFTIKTIAEQLGIAQGTASKYLPADIPHQPGKRKTKISDAVAAEIISLLRQGSTLRAISSTVGIPDSALRRFLFSDGRDDIEEYVEEKTVESLIALRRGGKAVWSIALQLGISQMAVVSHLPPELRGESRSYRKRTSKEISKIVALYRQGESMKTIAAKYKVAERTIYKYVTEKDRRRREKVILAKKNTS
jgi:DNA-binding CsgD family transcriptional regulator